MRKLLFIITPLIAIGLGGLWLIHRSVTPTTTSPVSKTATVFKKACDIFSLKDAVAVLGEGTTQTPSHTDSSTAQKSVTTCLYRYDPGSLSDIVSASLLLQGSSATAAKQSFSVARPSYATTVKGYGNAAFWDPSLGQLNILKGQYWVIISAGSGPLNQRQPDLPTKIADIIMKWL